MAFDREVSIEEENMHARRGCIIAVIILPILCGLILYPLLTFTARGRVITAHAVLFATHAGVPFPVPYIRGIPRVAEAGCRVDQMNPRPANYQERQDNLQTEYEFLVGTYNRYWNVLERNKGDTSLHEDPSQIPGQFSSGKLFYCR